MEMKGVVVGGLGVGIGWRWPVGVNAGDRKWK